MAVQSTDYEGRFKELQALEDKKDDLIVELLASLDALKAQRDEAKSDLETEREARRRLQRTIRDGQPNHPRFALLILHLDADVFLFEDSWITGEPATGGEKIATELVSKVTAHLQPILESPSNIQVMVKIYGDLFKLWRTYEAAGSNLGSSDLTRFFSHFNRKDSLVDFVDFGPRKGSIERKLSGVLGHHLADPRIEHILLGSPHTSLPPILAPHDTLLYTTDQKARLTLLTAPLNPKDWDDFGYKTTESFSPFFATMPLQASSTGGGGAPSSAREAKSPAREREGTPFRTHTKHKAPPPAAPVPPQAANVPRLRIRKELGGGGMEGGGGRSGEAMQQMMNMGGLGINGMGGMNGMGMGMNSYPPHAQGRFMPMHGALARRDTFPRDPRYAVGPPPETSIPSLQWP